MKYITKTFFVLIIVTILSTFSANSALRKWTDPYSGKKCQGYLRPDPRNWRSINFCIGKDFNYQIKYCLVGVKCVDPSKPTKAVEKIVPLKSQFNKLTLSQRKIVQENLYKKGIYLSKIDGLYGTNTKKALEIFNKEKFNSLDLKKGDNVKTLLSAIIDLNQTAQISQPIIEIAEKQNLNKKENTNELLDTIFSLDTKAPKQNTEKQNSEEEKTVKQLDAAGDIKKDDNVGTATIKKASDNNELEVSMFLCTSVDNSQKLFQLSESSKLGDIGGMGYRFQEKENVLFGPSDNGTAFAKFSDNNLLITSADDDWQGACVRLQNDIAKTLKGRTGISSDKSTAVNRNVNAVPENNKIKIRDEFINLSRNKRKHVQAALKSRGLYKSTIDGLYGKNTEAAIQRYIDEEVRKNPSYQQKSIRVMLNELRNQFAYIPPKEKKIEKFETSKYSFNAIVSNPKMSARQAYEMCDAVASSAALSAGNSRKRDYYSTDCSSFSSNSWSCTTSRGSGGGGFAAGFLDAWSRDLDRAKAKRIALRGCMAENGWSVSKK